MERLEQRLKAEEASADSQCVAEALDEVRALGPLPPLKYSAELTALAGERAEELCKASGSPQSEKLEPRFRAHGFAAGAMGESMLYVGDDESEEDIIVGMIVDGTPGRVRRRRIFNPQFSVAGVASRSRTRIGTVVVLSYFQ